MIYRVIIDNDLLIEFMQPGYELRSIGCIEGLPDNVKLVNTVIVDNQLWLYFSDSEFEDWETITPVRPVYKNI